MPNNFALAVSPNKEGVPRLEPALNLASIESMPSNAPEPSDEVYESLADRFFGTAGRAADPLTITASSPGTTILFNPESVATDHTLTPVARGKALFTRIVGYVASTLASGGADAASARAAAVALATQLGTPEFAELPRLAATSALPASLTGSPRSATRIALTLEGKVQVGCEFLWTPPVDSSPPAYGAVETEKSDPQEFTLLVKSAIWLEREIGAVSSAQAVGAARFVWHVQVESASRANFGAGPDAELKSGGLGLENHVCEALARVWGNAGFRVVPPRGVGGPPGDKESCATVGLGVVGAANWVAPRQPEESAGDRGAPPLGEGGAAERAAPPSPKGGAALPGALSRASASRPDGPGPVPVSMRAAPHEPQVPASSASAAKQAAAGARGWWTPTLYGSWLAAAAAYLTGTAVQFFEKLQALGAAATMLIYPVMQGGAIAEVVTVWWQGRKQAAEQRTRDEDLAKVGTQADRFRAEDAAYKLKMTLLKAQAGEQPAGGGALKSPEVAVDEGGQTEATQRAVGAEARPVRPRVEDARAALERTELTTLSAVAGLPARANRVWYVRDVYVQAGATVVRLLNWAGTKFGFLISPLLGAFTGLFGAVGGVLHIVQGTFERTRAMQDTATLKRFNAEVLGLASGEDDALQAATLKAAPSTGAPLTAAPLTAALSTADISRARLVQLDRRLREDSPGMPGKEHFRTLLEGSEEYDLSVASKLADVVLAKLSKNAEHMMEAAARQRRNANIRIGFGGGSVVCSLVLGVFAYLGIGGLLAVGFVTAVVTLAVGWLGFAVAEWVRAGRDKKQVGAPADAELEKIRGWADADLTTLEEKFLAEKDPEEFFVGALMARYLALSTNVDAQEESSATLDAQQPNRSRRFSKLRVKVTKRMCIQAAIDEFRALREVSDAAVKNPDKTEFVEIVTSITQHIEGKRGLERRLAAAANLTTVNAAA
ncbi:hypothetical protein [Pandoraea oxalativorans]|uniref:Uncharacterized protein n=1 Tax=Pandoraea oxalativorans TaxID=573737 RepID=A0A192B198_9BURK|nr:hypothetical protein [Pandoraea oxalativorans]ANJ86797.1 hypothetical protein MB84_31535 [Pandoraea oxalativorans]